MVSGYDNTRHHFKFIQKMSSRFFGKHMLWFLVLASHLQTEIPAESFFKFFQEIQLFGLHIQQREEIVFWGKNVFMVPSGSAGKDYVSDMTRLINIWTVNATDLHKISLKILTIMPALPLRKPPFKSKAKQHSECFKRRFT